jgi:hypothetical protein
MIRERRSHQCGAKQPDESLHGIEISHRQPPLEPYF